MWNKVWPMKFWNCWWCSGCLQLCGQLTITVLCFRPPRPPAWIRWDVPSLRLEETTTWAKPFTFSASISLRKDCRKSERKKRFAWAHSVWPVIDLLRALYACKRVCPWMTADLICSLGLSVAVQERSLHRSPDDGKTLACLQLIGQGEQARLFNGLLLINARQNQDLRPSKTSTNSSSVQQLREKYICGSKRPTASSWCVEAPPPASWVQSVQRWGRCLVSHHPTPSLLCDTLD